jgi:hypothetical protein
MSLHINEMLPSLPDLEGYGSASEIRVVVANYRGREVRVLLFSDEGINGQCARLLMTIINLPGTFLSFYQAAFEAESDQIRSRRLHHNLCQRTK